MQPAGGFTGIVPNPFNPKTEINFVLNRDNLTQLNIYDLRGQLVKVLVNEMLPAQEYKFFWDGSDLNGQRVSSGTYFARLRIGSEVMQVHKLMMVK
jgi:flagellar hook assembly protein FlgD